MSLQPYYLDIAQGLSHQGDMQEYCGVLSIDVYESAHQSYQITSPLHYNLVLTNTGDGILVTGLLQGALKGQCDKCLDDADIDISSEVNAYYLFEMPKDLSEDEDFLLVDSDERIELSSAFESALAVDIPFIVLCSPECKGLCPRCGVNLNHDTCTCLEPVHNDSNPFSVLAQLKL